MSRPAGMAKLVSTLFSERKFLRPLSRSDSPVQRCEPGNEGSPPCASGAPCALASSARATLAGNPRCATTAAKMNHVVLLPIRSPDVKQKRQGVS